MHTHLGPLIWIYRENIKTHSFLLKLGAVMADNNINNLNGNSKAYTEKALQ